MKYNMDIQTRDEIIFGSYEPDKYLGGAREYENLNQKELKELVALKFIDLEQVTELRPAVKDVLVFLTLFDGYTVSGFTIIDTREDYRVEITAISKEGKITEEEMMELFKLAKDADIQHITKDHVYCWWD